MLFSLIQLLVRFLDEERKKALQDAIRRANEEADAAEEKKFGSS